MSNYIRTLKKSAVFIAGRHEWAFQLDQISFEVPSDQFVSWPMGELFVASPAIFLIDNGIVREAADGNESDRFIETMFGDQEVPER